MHTISELTKKKLAFINDLCAIVLNVFREVFVTDNLLKDLKNWIFKSVSLSKLITDQWSFS